MSSATTTYVAVVDDDESMCRSYGRLLRAAGLQPITYDSAESFRADTKHPEFGCLVLDVQLGGMSGIELAQQLAAEGRRTPIIFITAHDEPEMRSAAKALGCPAKNCLMPFEEWCFELFGQEKKWGHANRISKSI
jgi:FixJ family two-component response regulator